MAYIPHDYWMICQRSGLKFRRSEMRKEWTGLWVYKDFWEPRHPQDFVKSVPENPSVDPMSLDVEPSMGETTLDGDAAKDATTITLTSMSGLADNDAIGVMMDNSVVHWTFITADPSGSDVTLNDGLPFAATDGNAVYLPSVNNERWN